MRSLRSSRDSKLLMVPCGNGCGSLWVNPQNSSTVLGAVDEKLPLDAPIRGWTWLINDQETTTTMTLLVKSSSTGFVVHRTLNPGAATEKVDADPILWTVTETHNGLPKGFQRFPISFVNRWDFCRFQCHGSFFRDLLDGIAIKHQAKYVEIHMVRNRGEEFTGKFCG